MTQAYADDYAAAKAGSGWNGSATWVTAKEEARVNGQRKYRETAPTAWEWAYRQPDRWQMICSVFAVNESTRGAIIGKSLKSIVRYSGSQGIPLGLSTIERYLPELYRHQVIKRIPIWHEDSTTEDPKSAPSDWILRLRNVMPEVIIPRMPDEGDPEYAMKIDERNDLWLRRTDLQGDTLA